MPPHPPLHHDQGPGPGLQVEAQPADVHVAVPQRLQHGGHGAREQRGWRWEGRREGHTRGVEGRQPLHATWAEGLGPGTSCMVAYGAGAAY